MGCVQAGVYALKVGAYQANVAGVIEQERIMTVGRINLGVAHVTAVVDQRFDYLAAALGAEAPVGREAHQQEFSRGAGQRHAELAAIGFGRVKVIERAGDQQVGIGIKRLAELVALVAQVAFNLEFNVLRGVLVGVAVTQCAAKLLIHHVVAQVRDVSNHPCDAQAALGNDVVLVEIAAVEVGVGHDGTSCHLVEGNVFCREIGRTGHDHRVFDAVRVLQRPAQRLHAAQAAAHDGRQCLDAQRVDHTGLRIYPIFDRHHWEIGTVGFARVWVGVHRAGGAKAGAQVIDANDKELVGVERFAWADHVVPPTLALGLALVHASNMVRSIERVTDQHGIGLVSVQRTVGFIRHRVVTDGGPALQRKRLRERKKLRSCMHKKTRQSQSRVHTGVLSGSLAEFIKRPQAVANRR